MLNLNTQIVKCILQKRKQKVCYTYEKTKWYKLNLERKKNKTTGRAGQTEGTYGCIPSQHERGSWDLSFQPRVYFPPSQYQL